MLGLLLEYFIVKVKALNYTGCYFFY